MRKFVTAVGKVDIFHAIRAVRQKGENVLSASGTAILRRCAEVTFDLHLQEIERVVQREPATIEGRPVRQIMLEAVQRKRLEWTKTQRLHFM